MDAKGQYSSYWGVGRALVLLKLIKGITLREDLREEKRPEDL